MKCPKCGKKLNYKDQLIGGDIKRIKGEAYYLCPRCKATFPKKESKR